MGRTIEVILASPPERNELVAQLFHTGGGQWGEIFRENGAYRLELYAGSPGRIHFDCEECLAAIQAPIRELRTRLED